MLGGEKRKIPFYRVTDAEAEVKRLENAGMAAENRLEEIYRKAVEQVGEEEAAIFRVHKMILQDSVFMDAVREMILSEKTNAEYAAAAAGERFAAQFAAMQDERMQSRAADVKDASQQLVAGFLEGAAGQGNRNSTTEPVIILAEDLSPSQTVQLDQEAVAAFVTVHGSVNSHTAILARTMNIPALIGTQLIPAEPVQNGCVQKESTVSLSELDGHLAVVDGYNGCFCVDPDKAYLRAVEDIIVKERKERAHLSALKGLLTIAPDGRRLKLCANIGSVKDLEAALDNDAEGIGLFRSECLYLGRETCPGEEEQFAVYRKVAEAMPDKRVVIRTMDIGADKQAEYLGLASEKNPAMGFRAIRICLTRTELLKTQLRAILRAAAYGQVAVLYPMVTSVWEVRRLRELLQEAGKELETEGKPYRMVEQGIMIETPAAAVISDLLAAEADFISIGTNDLTQYVLAVDRENGELDQFYDAYHPAVLRLIRMTVDNARQAGISCGICGELAADPAMTAHFLDWGVDMLSVSPGNILPLRKRILQNGGENEKL